MYKTAPGGGIMFEINLLKTSSSCVKIYEHDSSILLAWSGLGGFFLHEILSFGYRDIS